MRLEFTFVLLAAAACVAAEGKEDHSPIRLVADSSKVLTVPMFSFYNAPQCDSDGSLYFHTGRADNVVLELSPDGSPTLYKLDDTSLNAARLVAFHVTPDRKLWLLAGGKTDELYILHFNHNGTDSGKPTKLDTPEKIHAYTVRNFMMLTNDHVLLQGLLDEKAPKDEQGRTYLAEFDSFGTLLRNSEEKTSDAGLKFASNRGVDSGPAQGSDGLMYVLQPDKVVVISQTGKAVRRMKLNPPAPGYQPVQLYISGGRLVVSFSSDVGSGKPNDYLYALLDASNGELLRLYEPSPETGKALVCFSDDAFTFMGRERGRVKLIKAGAK